ncbi:MAG: stage II sporulation protein M, partial [Planctomycetota bacterium]
MGVQELRSVGFRRERAQTWRQLESLVSRVEKSGLRSLKPSELLHLPALYRATLSSLSVARSISLDRNVTEYLESLTSRAYCCVYGTRGSLLASAGRFFAQRLPAAFRNLLPQIVLAGVLLLLGASVGFALTYSNQERFYDFVPSSMAAGRNPEATTKELRDTLYSDGSVSGGELALFSSLLFTHNAQIGFSCFVVGFAAGVPVLYILFVNGLLLGAFAALFHQRGLGVELWAW